MSTPQIVYQDSKLPHKIQNCYWNSKTHSLVYETIYDHFHHANARMLPQNRPRQLLNTYFPIHYAVIILPFYAIHCQELALYINTS
jgi:hypothetical protein